MWSHYILKPRCWTLIAPFNTNLKRNKKYPNLKMVLLFLFFHILIFFFQLFTLRCLLISDIPLYLYLLVPWPVFHEPFMDSHLNASSPWQSTLQEMNSSDQSNLCVYRIIHCSVLSISRKYHDLHHIKGHKWA